MSEKVVFLKKASQDFPENLDCIQLEKYQFDFEQKLQADDFIVKILFIAIDPIMRIFLSGAQTYYPPLKAKDTVHALTVAKVIKSNNSNYKVNDVLFANTGVTQYQLMDSFRRQFIFPSAQIPSTIPLQSYLNVVNNGVAAYFGVEICQLKQNHTFVVSTAAGATGMLACQIAKIKYQCRVIGITGSEDKCKFLEQELKIDKAINYNDKNFVQQLKNSCPNGIDGYFDNVGEQQLEAALTLINNHGRIALCGAMSSQFDFFNRKGIRNYQAMVMKRVFIKGYLVAEFLGRSEEVFKFFSENIQNGKLKCKETVFKGINNYMGALQHCFRGKNIGKVLVQINDDELIQKITPKL